MIRGAALIAIIELLLTGLASAQEVRLKVRQTTTFEQRGATAAYLVEASFADVATDNGLVTIRGLRAGTTQLVVVRPDDVVTYDLVVEPSPSMAALAEASSLQHSLTAWQSMYASQTSRLTTQVDISNRSGGRSTELHVAEVSSVGMSNRGDARSSVPAASLHFHDAQRDVTFLDAVVNQSPLTLSGTSLRGLHAHDGRFDVHAGYTTPILFQNLFLPFASEAAAGISARFTMGTSALVPSVYYFSGQRQYSGTSGTLASLVFEHGTSQSPFWVRAEAGYGRKPGGSADVAYAAARQQFDAHAVYRPLGMSALGFGQPAGSSGRLSWTDRLSSAMIISASGEITRQEFATFRQDTTSINLEDRYRLAAHWTAAAGAVLNQFAANGQKQRGATAPLSLTYQRGRGSLAGLYRYQWNSATNRGGSGGRVNGRIKLLGLSFGALADYQRDAATVDLAIRDVPGLAQALAELGLSKPTVDDIARVLREDPALVQLEAGGALTLNATRFRSTLDAAWLPRSGAQLRLRMLTDSTRSLRGRQQTTLAGVWYVVPLGGHLDLQGSVTRFVDGPPAWGHDGEWSFEIGARFHVKGLRAIPFAGSRGTVRGIVFNDNDATGRYTASMGSAGPVKVLLDGSRAVTTAPDGRFAFDRVSSGPHSVEVLLPSAAASYFTTPSTVTAARGDMVTVGIAQMPGRLIGVVHDDVGGPIAGVTLALAAAASQMLAISDSSGHYTFSVAPGDYTVTVKVDTVPIGYDSGALTPQMVTLSRGQPVTTDYVMPANRTLAGMVQGKSVSSVTARLVELNRTAVTGADGAYVFRRLPPGTFTVEADVDGMTVRRTVVVPPGPAMIRNIDLVARQSGASR